MKTLLLAVAVALFAQAKPASLPQTPQGKHVDAWVTAFNTGDEQTFLSAQREHMTPAVLEKRPEAERRKMFQRLRGDFGAMTIDKILTSSAERIQFTTPARDGGVGTFTFEFEPKAPYRIASIGIDVEGNP